MKFIVDAQLPRQLSRRLVSIGHDSLHALDLPDGNRSTDQVLTDLSVSEQRVLVTKDTDFVDSLIIRKVPFKLLLVGTGNLGNRELLSVFFENLGEIVTGFATFDFIEIDQTAIRFHF
jgi:predicted nuclease of predicted toxin-antitoxin system